MPVALPNNAVSVSFWALLASAAESLSVPANLPLLIVAVKVLVTVFCPRASHP